MGCKTKEELARNLLGRRITRAEATAYKKHVLLHNTDRKDIDECFALIEMAVDEHVDRHGIFSSDSGGELIAEHTFTASPDFTLASLQGMMSPNVSKTIMESIANDAKMHQILSKARWSGKSIDFDSSVDRIELPKYTLWIPDQLLVNRHTIHDSELQEIVEEAHLKANNERIQAAILKWWRDGEQKLMVEYVVSKIIPTPVKLQRDAKLADSLADVRRAQDGQES